MSLSDGWNQIHSCIPENISDYRRMVVIAKDESYGDESLFNLPSNIENIGNLVHQRNRIFCNFDKFHISISNTLNLFVAKLLFTKY